MITLTKAQHAKLDKLAETDPEPTVVGHLQERPLLRIADGDYRVLCRNGSLRRVVTAGLYHGRPRFA